MRRDRTSVVVVDQHEIFRTGLSSILETLPAVVITGVGSTAEDALRLVRSEQPEVLLLDAGLEANGPGSLVRQLRQTCMGTAVIVLSADPRPNDVLATVAAGASGYLLKSALRDDIAASLERVAAAETFVDPVLAGRLVHALADEAAVASAGRRPEPLTPREREVLAKISHGRSNKEIATDLRLASGTVKVHVERILRKLSAANRVEAATIGLHHGLISDETPVDSTLGESPRPHA